MKLKTLSLVISTVIATTSFSATVAFISNAPQPAQVLFQKKEKVTKPCTCYMKP